MRGYTTDRRSGQREAFQARDTTGYKVQLSGSSRFRGVTAGEKHHVLPMDDRLIERTNAAIAGRPDVMGDRTSLTLYEGMQGMLENTFMNVGNRYSKITAELDIPAEGANGAILSQGGPLRRLVAVREGRQAGLHLQLSRARARYTVAAPKTLPEGSATVVLDSPMTAAASERAGKRRST